MKKKKILVIDDFLPLLEEVVEFLSFEGYQTYSAKDGAEGIQMAIQHNPDLIICDIEMPRMDGYEVFKTLEKISVTASIPFIFLTARAQVEDFRAGLQLGVDDYITKPFESDDLIMSISKRLSKHERLKNINQSKFDILIKNPLIGIFIYVEDRFIMINKKFEKITSYSKNEMNKQKLSNLILADTDIVISKLKTCLKNIHEKVQMKISFLNKDKKAIFIELFAKYVEIDSNNALIGSIIEINKTNSEKIVSSGKNSVAEFEKIVDYLVSIGKDDIADEIINVKELISFESDSEIQKVKKKVKLTKRENEILNLICDGLTNNEIAKKLFISSRTVDNHRANLLSKTNTKNTASLVSFAFKNQLVKL